MENLIRGIHHFQNNVYSGKRELFERLAKSQTPDALFITCSDSRINPNLITHTEPGELFILRNAGNIIPPHGAGSSGENATIEFAVTALGIRDIIVCGHTECGAIKGLIWPEMVEGMPSVGAWLSHAEATRRIIQENYNTLSLEQQANVACQENVLVQIENLKTLPSVASAMARGQLNIHAWMFKIQTAEVFAFDSEQGQYFPIMDSDYVPSLQGKRLNSLQTI